MIYVEIKQKKQHISMKYNSKRWQRVSLIIMTRNILMEYTYGIYIFINESTHQRSRERNTTKERASPGSISHSSYGIAAAISQLKLHIYCFSLIFIGTRMIRQSSLWFANKSTAFSFKRRMLSKGGIFRHNCEDLSLIEHRLD